MDHEEREYQGVDRRRPDPWRFDMESRIDRIESAVTCIKKHGDLFEQTYGPILRETLEAKASRAKLWAIATEELVKKGVWAALVVVVTAALLGGKEYIRRWLTS